MVEEDTSLLSKKPRMPRRRGARYSQISSRQVTSDKSQVLFFLRFLEDDIRAEEMEVDEAEEVSIALMW